jgi:hypothetical protein
LDLRWDNWRSRCKEDWPSGAEVEMGLACLIRSGGSPCRLVAGWEPGGRKRQGHPIAIHDQNLNQLDEKEVGRGQEM